MGYVPAPPPSRRPCLSMTGVTMEEAASITREVFGGLPSVLVFPKHAKVEFLTAPAADALGCRYCQRRSNGNATCAGCGAPR